MKNVFIPLKEFNESIDSIKDKYPTERIIVYIGTLEDAKKAWDSTKKEINDNHKMPRPLRRSNEIR